MTVLRRKNLFLLWLLCSLLWLAFVVEVFNYQGDPDSKISAAAIFLLPPSILFLAGLGLARILERFAEPHWLRLPENLRRGIARLYLVVAVPWVAWFIYQIFDAGSHYDFEDDELSHAFWSLLIVPIGGPILFAIIVWVVTGFQGTGARNKETKHIQTSKRTPDAPQLATQPNDPPEPPPDYYALISRAVCKLPTNNRATRQELYQRAREALHNILRGQERSRRKTEWRAFEQATRKVEAENRKLEPGSTGLLAILLFLPGLWAIDFTSMSLFWTARPPQVGKPKSTPIGLWKLLFSFSGRLGRGKYWGGLAIAFCVGFLATKSPRFVTETTLAFVLLGTLLLLYLLIVLTVAIKRLHDLDLSGWWACGFSTALYLTAAISHFTEQPMFIGLGASLLFFAGAIWLGSARGTPGQNRFGPDPLSEAD